MCRSSFLPFHSRIPSQPGREGGMGLPPEPGGLTPPQRLQHSRAVGQEFVPPQAALLATQAVAQSC